MVECKKISESSWGNSQAVGRFNKYSPRWIKPFGINWRETADKELVIWLIVSSVEWINE